MIFKAINNPNSKRRTIFFISCFFVCAFSLMAADNTQLITYPERDGQPDNAVIRYEKYQQFKSSLKHNHLMYNEKPAYSIFDLLDQQGNTIYIIHSSSYLTNHELFFIKDHDSVQYLKTREDYYQQARFASYYISYETEFHDNDATLESLTSDQPSTLLKIAESIKNNIKPIDEQIKKCSDFLEEMQKKSSIEPPVLKLANAGLLEVKGLLKSKEDLLKIEGSTAKMLTDSTSSLPPNSLTIAEAVTQKAQRSLNSWIAQLTTYSSQKFLRDSLDQTNWAKAEAILPAAIRTNFNDKFAFHFYRDIAVDGDTSESDSEESSESKGDDYINVEESPEVESLARAMVALGMNDPNAIPQISADTTPELPNVYTTGIPQIPLDFIPARHPMRQTEIAPVTAKANSTKPIATHELNYGNDLSWDWLNKYNK